MIQNKVVVRYQNGEILKGQTSDFLPTKSLFHLSLIDAPPDTPPFVVQIAGVKAIFFVKDFAGNREREEILGFPAEKPAIGRKIRVDFHDGETLVGTTQGYDPSRPGFFVIPADAGSNNDRCFVIASAAKQVSFI
jgi:small nuclear ribonucleoprotein (snRNP)-like protein